MEWVSQKWGGRPHRRGELHDLGADRHGRWFYGPKGDTVTFGSGDIRGRERDAMFLLRDGWWCASWWVDHPEIAVYVDITTPPQWHARHVVTVDLDLDVIRFVDGRVEVHDRDEFELHRARYGYSREAVEAAERATTEVFDLVRRHAPPFDDLTASMWWSTALTP